MIPINDPFGRRATEVAGLLPRIVRDGPMMSEPVRPPPARATGAGSAAEFYSLARQTILDMLRSHESVSLQEVRMTTGLGRETSRAVLRKLLEEEMCVLVLGPRPHRGSSGYRYRAV